MNIKFLSEINHFYSVSKLLVYFLCGVSLIIVVIFSHNLLLTITAQFLLGIVFAHGLELQHECLHGNMFKPRILNHFFGFILGAPMLVSFTHYKIQHLHHHRYLGTEKDVEFFDYDELHIKNLYQFLLRAFNFSRIPSFFALFFNFIRGKYPDSFNHKIYKRQAIEEYSILTLIFVITTAFSIIKQSTLLLETWFIPWLLFGEAFHFLVELPEHIGCQKQNRNVYINTRSINSNHFFRYIVNGNNYHVEHHLYPKIAFHNLPLVHDLNKQKIINFYPSYSSFFKDLVLKRTLSRY